MRVSRCLRMLRPPEPLGHLVDSNSSRVSIVRSGSPQEPVVSYSRQDKLAVETKAGQSPNPGMARIPKGISANISKMTVDRTPQELRQRVARMYSRMQAGEGYIPALESIDVEAQITGLFLQNYAGVTNALREVNKRTPEFNPESVLDVGFGPSTGLLAAREVFSQEAFPTETSVIIGHPRMKQRAKELLGESNTQFRYEIPSQSSPKRFDLIIAQHQLFQPGRFAEDLVASHIQQLANLLTKNGVIVLVERGDPLGFEAVALAREHLLRPKHGFSVIGPCTHNHACPLQLGLETRMMANNAGKENWCRFSQQIERPKFTLELKKGQYLAQSWMSEQSRGPGGKGLKGNGRPFGNNHEVANFSWVAMQNSPPSTAAQQPGAARIMKQPMKRHGHVTMEVCESSGQIEHWTVPRSQGKQAYHDARKASESDVWMLDAKVKQRRGGIKENSKMKPAKTPEEIRMLDVCNDWWAPKVNPHFKFSSHQARVHSENNVEPADESFLTAMDSLIDDEGRHDKLLRKQLQKRYRK